MRTRTRITLAGLVLGATLAGGVAWATIPGPVGTIPDASGVIHGCYRANSEQQGQLRIVDDPASCRSNELAIQWNEKGVAGATGAQGPKGDTGATGAKGEIGPGGATGAQGVKGDPGVAGANGTNGLDGSNGAPGTAGAAGANGVSPTVSSLAPRDPNCPMGGAAITDAAGTTAYVCSGQNGQPGADGQPFSGTFTSPDGQYSLSLTNTGAELKGPGGTVKIGPALLDVTGLGGSLRINPSSTAIQGAILTLNGCSKPVARLGDAVTGVVSAPATTPGIFPEDASIAQVRDIITRTDVAVPRIGASVSVLIPPMSVAGVISTGAPTVCIG